MEPLNTEPELRWYTTADVARMLQLRRETVIRYIKRGTLPAIKIGRDWRIAQDDFRAWVGRPGDPTKESP